MKTQLLTNDYRKTVVVQNICILLASEFYVILKFSIIFYSLENLEVLVYLTI